MKIENRKFWKKIEKRDGCWIWTGANNGSGVPAFCVDGKVVSVHRWVWELNHGPIPHGFMVGRTCGNRMCVKPSHLKLVVSRGWTGGPKLSPVQVAQVRERLAIYESHSPKTIAKEMGISVNPIYQIKHHQGAYK